MPPFPKEPEPRDYCPYLCSAEELEASHARCRSSGVPVELERPAKILDEASLAPRLKANSVLITFSERVITPDCYTGPPKNFIYILCDPELAALKIFAAPEVLAAAEDLGIKPGTVFIEASCGTNALAMSREHKRIKAIRGEQHYCKLFKDWWCIAGPVKDPLGNIVGYLDVSMHAATELGLTAIFLSKLLKLLEVRLTPFKSASLGNDAFDILAPVTNNFCNNIRQLSSREEEILQLLLIGLNNLGIAARLNISMNTVKVHRSNIYRKLGVQNFHELMVKLYR